MSPDEQPTILTSPPNGSRPASMGWQAPSVEEMQAMLPQYEVIDILGRGGMGAVYKARQKSLKRLVAIKILPLGMADDEMKFVERFQNEAQTMAAMNHPAIVSVYDFGETANGLLYFIMEYVDGSDVHKLIQASGKLSDEYALAITAHVCDALDYAHKRGVIHRDIKPANILIDQEGHIKVADFGLAKMDDPSMTSGLTKTNMAMGTPDYVAPEVLSPGMVADHRADLYAVGVMLYQMLTGEVPRGMFKLPSQKGIGSDPRFDQIICKAMEQDREERYQSAMDVRHALDVILTTPQPKDDGTGIVSESQIPQKPVAKQPRPPGEKSEPPQPTRNPSPPPQRGAEKKPADKSVRAPVRKSSATSTWLSIGGIVVVLGVAGFLVLGGKPKPQATTTTDSASAAAPSAIPQPPIKVSENPKPTAAASSASAKGKVIDLLALVDVKRDAIAGEWVRTADGLVKKGGNTTSEGAPRLQLPYQPPEEYDFEIEFTPTTGTQSLGQMIVTESRMFSWIINGGRVSEPMIGFEMFDGKATSTPSEVSKRMDGELVNGRRYRSRVEARAGSLRAFLDDKEIVNWSGKPQRLSLDTPSRLRDDGHLGLRAVRETTFHKITVREISGAGKVDAGIATSSSSATAKTIDLLPLVDVKRDAVAGLWSRTAEGLVKTGGSDGGSGPRLQLPYQPAGDYDFEIEFTATGGRGNIGQILAAQGREFGWMLNTGDQGNHRAGFGLLDGKKSTEPTETTAPLKEGIVDARRYRSRVEVRTGSLRAFLDDAEIVNWTGDFSRLANDVKGKLRDSGHIGLRLDRDAVFHKITVREVSGAGKVDTGIATSSSSATAKTIDLLSLADVKRDAIAGEWSREGGDLLVKATKPDAKGTPRLQLPYQPPEEYDFEIEFTPESGTNMVGQALSAYQRSFSWFLDAQLTAGNKAGFNEIDGVSVANRTDGTTMRSKFLTNGQRHRSTVEVRRNRVRALLDGETLVTWGSSPKSYERLDIWKNEKLSDALHLGLIAYDRTVRFHKITVREITGTGKMDAPRAAASPASYPPGTEKIDWLKSAAWKEPWSLESGRLKSTTNGKSRYFGVGRDVTVRMRFREATAPESKEPPLQLGFRGGPNGGSADRSFSYLLQIYPTQKQVQLLFMTKDTRANVDVPEFLWKDQPFPSSALSNGDMDLELRVIGQDLSLWSGATQIAAIRDGRAQSGAWVLSGSPGVEITALETSGITPNPGTISPPEAGNAPPQISNWQDVTDASREKAKSIPGLIVDPQGIRWEGTGYKMRLPLPQVGQRDQAISVHYTGQAQVDLRISQSGFIYVLAQTKQTIIQGQPTGVTEPVKLATTQLHPADFDPERPHELLVTMEGTRLRVWLDGRFVSEGNVDAYSEGESGLMVMRKSVVHQIKVANLQNNNQTISEWTDWLGPKLAAGDFAANGWVRSSNGVTTEREISGTRLLPPGTKNAAVRVTYVLQDSEGLMLNARERMDGKVRLGYCAIDKVTQLHLNRLKPDGRSAALQHVILPVEADRMAERTLELRMIGNQITATLNGTFAGTATDDTLSEGEWTIVFLKGVLVKKVEVQPLDAAP